MTERTRIENPICETCRWFVRNFSRDSDHNKGVCYCNPPTVVEYSHVSFQLNPKVDLHHFCSHHESAFGDPEDEKYPLLHLKFFRDISNENRIFILNKLNDEHVPMVTTNEQVHIFNKLIENGKGEDLWMWFGKIQTMGGH